MAIRNPLTVKYLKAGVITTQGYEKMRFGTLQNGNLLPLLPNTMLNELNKKLEVRRLGFTRYTDAFVIAARNEPCAKKYRLAGYASPSS